MSTSASEIFDLRNFFYYLSGNVFTGSLGSFSYKITPKDNELKVMTWHGMLCSELAKIEHEADFPLTKEGFDDMVKWLEDVYNTNP